MPSRRVSHILVCRDQARLRWRVFAGTDRGGTRGDPVECVTQREAMRVAGRLARRYRARAALVIDGERVRELAYRLKGATLPGAAPARTRSPS